MTKQTDLGGTFTLPGSGENAIDRGIVSLRSRSIQL